MAEFDHINWIKAKNTAHSRLLVPPGDDTALVLTSSATLMAADMLLEGVHFDLGTTPAPLVGRKALAVNLSDIAAMAGNAVAFTVSLALPQGRGPNYADTVARELFLGMDELARQFNVALAGGDTNAWNGPLVIDVAIIGDAPRRGPVRRQGAQAGDWIFVTGSLGGSLTGHHLTFQPRLREAAILHERYGLSAMIDISDGLSQDLGHILAASRCGARLDKKAIPISAAAALIGDGQSPLQHAMHDGEDFELCFTVNPSIGAKLLRDQPLADLNSNATLTKIGEITESADYMWTDGSPVTRRGYEHSF